MGALHRPASDAAHSGLDPLVLRRFPALPGQPDVVLLHLPLVS